MYQVVLYNHSRLFSLFLNHFFSLFIHNFFFLFLMILALHYPSSYISLHVDFIVSHLPNPAFIHYMSPPPKHFL